MTPMLKKYGYTEEQIEEMNLVKKEKEYQVLNSGVGSYSPTNYYYKIKYY